MRSSVSSIHLSFFMYWDVCHNVFYCGSSPADILLHHFPSILSSPLSKLVLAKIRAARDIGFGAHWHREKSSLTSYEVSSPPPILLSSSAKPLGGGAFCSQAPWPSSAYLCTMGHASYRATLAEQCPLGLSDSVFF